MAKQFSYTVAFKLSVLKFAPKKLENGQASREFGVNEKLVRGWRKKKSELSKTCNLYSSSNLIFDLDCLFWGGVTYILV